MTGIQQVLAAGSRSRLLKDIINRLLLTTSWVLCLDAADIASYDGSSQTWTDVSGAGNDFFRGATGGATATDPTFVGVAGDGLSTTHFSLDGGDYFNEAAAHTFADAWHQNNGAFTFVFVFYMTAAGAGVRALFGNEIAGGGIGININISAADELVFTHTFGGAGANEDFTSTATFVTDSWNFAAVSFDEATNTARLHINGTVETIAPSSSTDASTPNETLHLCADGTGGSAFDAGDLFACTAAWSVAQSQANVDAVRAGLAPRFGLP